MVNMKRRRQAKGWSRWMRAEGREVSSRTASTTRSRSDHYKRCILWLKNLAKQKHICLTYSLIIILLVPLSEHIAVHMLKICQSKVFTAASKPSQEPAQNCSTLNDRFSVTYHQFWCRGSPTSNNILCPSNSWPKYLLQSCLLYACVPSSRCPIASSEKADNNKSIP